MSGFVPKRVRYARMRTKTNQTGLKMSGNPAMLGRRGYIQRYVNRRVQPNVGVCGYPHGYRCIYEVEPDFDKSTGKLLNPEAVKQNCKLVVNGVNGVNCEDEAPKNQSLAGGVGRINAPRFHCGQTCFAEEGHPHFRKTKIPIENVVYHPTIGNTMTIPWWTGTQQAGYSPGILGRIYTLLFFVNGAQIAPAQEAKSIISITTTLTTDQKNYWSLDQDIKQGSKHPGELTLLKQNSPTFPTDISGLSGQFTISVTYKPYDESAKEPPKTKIFLVNYNIVNQPIPQPTPGGGDGIYDIMYTNASKSLVNLTDFWNNAFTNPDGGTLNLVNHWSNKKLAIAPQIYTVAAGAGNPAAAMKTDANALVPASFSDVELWFRPEGTDVSSTKFLVCDDNFLVNVSNALVPSYILNINEPPGPNGLTGMIFTQETQNTCTGPGKTEWPPGDRSTPTPMSGLSNGYNWQSNIIFQGHWPNILPTLYSNFICGAPQIYEIDFTGLITGLGSSKPEICNPHQSAGHLYVSYKQAKANTGWLLPDDVETTIMKGFAPSTSEFEEYIKNTVLDILNTWTNTQYDIPHGSPGIFPDQSLVPVFAFGSVGGQADVSFDAEGAAYFLHIFETLTNSSPTSPGIFKQWGPKIKYLSIYNAGNNKVNENNYGSYLSSDPCGRRGEEYKTFWNAAGSGGSLGNIAKGQK